MPKLKSGEPAKRPDLLKDYPTNQCRSLRKGWLLWLLTDCETLTLPWDHNKDKHDKEWKLQIRMCDLLPKYVVDHERKKKQFSTGNNHLQLWLSWLRIHLQCGRPGFDPWVWKIPWRRERLPTPVFWPGEFHGLYSPWGCKESDTAG